MAIAESAGPRVLVVDDDEAQRLLIRRVLAGVGITDVFEEWEADQVMVAVDRFAPDVVTLDLGLRGGSGRDVLARLGERHAHWGRPLVLVVTGDTRFTLAEAADLAHGVLHKPYQLDQLAGAVTRLVGEIGAETAATTPTPHPPVRIIDVVRQLAGAHTEAEVLRIVRGAARQFTGAEGVTVVLRDGDQSYYVDEEAIAPLWKGQRFPLESCISGWAMIHRQPVAIEDIYTDDRVPHEAYRPTFVRSLAMVPIRTEEPIGAIGAYWARHHSATETELGMLQALADSTAVALQNVRLFDQLETVHDRTAELTSTNDQLRDFVYSVAHDLRSPLATIEGLATVVLRNGDTAATENRDAVTAIAESARRLSLFVTDLLDFATADGRTLQAELLVLGDVVDDVLERVHADLAARQARVLVDADIELVADRAMLAQVLQNLITNAVRYTPGDREPEVHIAVRTTSEGWELTVADNGSGVPTKERQLIFEPFRRGSVGREHHGTGLGLALCRRVAQRHGGDILVRDSAHGGAEFVMHLVR